MQPITIRGWNPASNERVEFTLPAQYNDVIIIDGVLDSLKTTMPEWVHRKIEVYPQAKTDLGILRAFCESCEVLVGTLYQPQGNLSIERYELNLKECRTQLDTLLRNYSQPFSESDYDLIQKTKDLIGRW